VAQRSSVSHLEHSISIICPLQHGDWDWVTMATVDDD